LEGTDLSPLPRPKKSRVQAADFAALKHPRSLALSPDGQLLAFTLWRCDFDKKKYYANLHVLDTATGEARQWTFGDVSDRSPVWSPDGERLAFFREEQGEDRIYIIPRSGGEAQLAFKTRGSFAAMKWAGDHTLVVKFRKADPDADTEKAIADGKDHEDKSPAVRKISRLYYRLDGDGYLPDARWHLYVLDLATKEFTPLTQGKADVESWDVAPDGETIGYIANVHRDPDVHPFHMQIHLLNRRTGKLRELDVPLGEKDAISFSPDGKYLVYLGHHNLDDAWGVEHVHPWLVDLRTGKSRNLTPGYDRQPGDLTVSDLGFAMGLPEVIWSRDSKQIYYQISDEGDTALVRIGLRPGEPERIWNQRGAVVLFTGNGSGLALHHVGVDNLGELYFCDHCSDSQPEFRMLAHFNRAYLASRVVGKTREVRFKSGDGTKVHGWLITPPDFSPRKKYPAILEVHGGPRLQYGRVFFHEMQYLAAQGFVVFITNPRGSQGYGKEFAASTVAAWGTDDFNDVMAAADYLESLSFVDKKRIGITGGSYGGYMTNLCVGRTHRFRAAVTQRSVVDLRTFAGTSDIGHQDSYEFGGHHWENPEGYEKMSPITYAHNIRTPLLIFHNEFDQRCSIEQAEQLFAHVKIRTRTPVEFWRFPDEPHGMSRVGRPDRRVIRLEGMAEWFKKWMSK
jgi:dipeptidyl aminopeptidase/acylaminoacyl peptidase